MTDQDPDGIGIGLVPDPPSTPPISPPIIEDDEDTDPEVEQ